MHAICTPSYTVPGDGLNAPLRYCRTFLQTVFACDSKMSSRSPQNEVLGPYGTLKHSLVQPNGPEYRDNHKNELGPPHKKSWDRSNR